MFSRMSRRGCAAQLSTSNKIFLPCRCSSLSQTVSHELKLAAVIQAFEFAQYVTGRLSSRNPVKHLGFALLPITKIFRLSVPDMFGQTIH
jgi:hypothetical protein